MMPPPLDADHIEISDQKSVAEVNTPADRSLIKRIIFAVVWFVGFSVLCRMVIGGIIGGIAGSLTTDFESTVKASLAATTAFFHKYGLLLIVVQAAVVGVLSLFGFLPGTGRKTK